MITKLDQKLIDFLTMICWWAEVRWDKNNLYWAYYINIISNLLLFIFGTFLLVEVFNVGTKFWIFFCSSFVFVCGIVICLKILFPEKMMKHFYMEIFPQGSPNPCRVSSVHISDRKFFLFAPFILSGSYYLQDISKFAEYELAWSTAFFFAFVFCFIFEYLMACDSMPPGEKERRRLNIEKWEGNFQPVQISSN